MDAAQILQQAVEALNAGELEKAQAQFREVSQLRPHDAPLQLELAAALWTAYDFEGALKAYERASVADPIAAAPCVLAAEKLFGIGRFRDCARWLEQAVARAPSDPAVHTMLGEVYDRANRLDDAERCAHEVLARHPQQLKAVRLLAHLERRRGKPEAARNRLTDHLSRFPGPEDWRLRYELAVVLDRLGEYDAAMHEVLQAKEQLRPQAQPFVAQAQAISQRQIEVAKSLTRQDFESWRQALSPALSTTPITFLCGHPRSGTTLLEQILDSHPDAVSTDETGILVREFIEPIVRQAASADASVTEIRAFTPEQLADGRAAYRRFTEAHIGQPIGKRLLVEKEPSLTPDLPLPVRLFPEAKVIFPLRDPRDVCISYFFTLVPLNAASAPALDLRTTLEFCAHSLRSWDHWRKMLPQPCLETRYEDLVTQPEREVSRLVQFLGLRWDQRLLTFHERAHEKGIRTPTYADVSQPLYRRAVGRWKNYEKHLTPHLEILRPYLRIFGYE